MEKWIRLLPLLIFVSFPVLYFSGHAGSAAGSFAGIALLLLGMAGTLFKRFFSR